MFYCNIVCLNIPPVAPTKPPFSAAASTTTTTTTTVVNDHSIVLLSSESEDDDELPSLAQRIGLATKTACNGLTSGSCVKQTSVVDMYKERTVEMSLEDSRPEASNCIPATSGSESSPASCMAGMAALKRHSGPEDVIVMTTAPCTSANTNTICCSESQASTKQSLTLPR